MVSLPPTEILTVEELQTSLCLTTSKNYSCNDGSKECIFTMIDGNVAVLICIFYHVTNNFVPLLCSSPLAPSTSPTREIALWKNSLGFCGKLLNHV